MSKILVAQCNAQVVTVDGFPVEAEILSQGNKPSEGAALIQGEKVFYVTSNASDIKDILVQLDAILTQIVTITTALNAVTVPPGTATAQITALTTLQTQLALLQEGLK